MEQQSQADPVSASERLSAFAAILYRTERGLREEVDRVRQLEEVAIQALLVCEHIRAIEDRLAALEITYPEAFGRIQGELDYLRIKIDVRKSAIPIRESAPPPVPACADAEQPAGAVPQ